MPFITTIFLFIFVSNWSGALIPWKLFEIPAGRRVGMRRVFEDGIVIYSLVVFLTRSQVSWQRPPTTSTPRWHSACTSLICMAACLVKLGKSAFTQSLMWHRLTSLAYFGGGLAKKGLGYFARYAPWLEKEWQNGTTCNCRTLTKRSSQRLSCCPSTSWRTSQSRRKLSQRETKNAFGRRARYDIERALELGSILGCP